MNNIIQKLEGRHDFRNFCKEENGIDCNRILYKAFIENYDCFHSSNDKDDNEIDNN